MKLELITAPTEDAVHIPDFLDHARFSDRHEDPQIKRLLQAAQKEAEEYLWQKLITQTWDEYFDAFANPLKLSYPPLSSVTSVKYVDTDGVTQTLATSVWEAGDEDGIGTVRLAYNQSWPSVRGHEDTVIVRFVCGYGGREDVPEQIRQAIRIHALHYFRHREGEPTPKAFYDLLRPYSARRFLDSNGQA